MCIHVNIRLFPFCFSSICIFLMHNLTESTKLYSNKPLKISYPKKNWSHFLKRFLRMVLSPINVHAFDFNFRFLLAAPVNDNQCLFLGSNTTLENMQEEYQAFAKTHYCNKEPENMNLVPCHMTKRAYHANFKVFRKGEGSVEGMAKGCVPSNCTKWVTCIPYPAPYLTFSLGVNWVFRRPELLKFLKSKL